LQLTTEPGWFGHFTRQQATRARFSNGTVIRKVKEDPGDGTPLGTEGTVLGSIYHPTLGVGYFVEWANLPKTAVFVVGWKIERGKIDPKRAHPNE
jgi:hypothetical protein